jgi:hypothetical protein
MESPLYHACDNGLVNEELPGSKPVKSMVVLWNWNMNLTRLTRKDLLHFYNDVQLMLIRHMLVPIKDANMDWG